MKVAHGALLFAPWRISSVAVAAAREHRVHEKARHAPVFVGVWMDRADQPVPPHNPCGVFFLLFKKIELPGRVGEEEKKSHEHGLTQYIYIIFQ